MPGLVCKPLSPRRPWPAGDRFAPLRAKIGQMAGMQEDMKNLLDNIRIGNVFVDRQMLIRRFTRDALKVNRLAGRDIARPLADIRSELQGGDLPGDAQAVPDSLAPTGTWCACSRTGPYTSASTALC